MATQQPQANPKKSIYPTSFYQDAGIRLCPECGEKWRTSMNGQRYCPDQLQTCPLKGSTDVNVQQSGQSEPPVSPGNPTGQEASA